MGAVAQVLTGLLQRGGDFKIRHGRKFNGGVFQGGMLIADGTGGHHHIPRLNLQVDTAAGAHPDEGIRPDGCQLLHGNGGRGAADAGRTDGNLLPQQGTGVDVVFPVHTHMHRIVKMGGDGLTPPRVTGQKNITPHVPRHTMNVELHPDILHFHRSF